MNKLLIKGVFDKARDLAQSGRLRNEIYCKRDKIYILNLDNTVLLQFNIPSAAKFEFDKEVSFNSSDFQSHDFAEEDGRVIFTIKNNDFISKRICEKAFRQFSDIDNLFVQYFNVLDKNFNVLSFPCSVISMLDERLSHVEITGDIKKLLLLQRDIYSGGKIEIKDKLTGLNKKHLIRYEFGPTGVRTDDFIAVFNFAHEKLNFYFGGENKYGLLEGEIPFGPSASMLMRGVIAGCVYDEMGIIETLKTEGVTNGG